MTSPRLQRRETMTYVVGYGLALLLTCAAFGLVYFGLLGTWQAFYAVLGLSLFWHFLDVIWIAIFSVVYLQGSIR